MLLRSGKRPLETKAKRARQDYWANSRVPSEPNREKHERENNPIERFQAVGYVQRDNGSEFKTMEPIPGILPLKNNTPFTISNRDRYKGVYAICPNAQQIQAMNRNQDALLLVKVGMGGSTSKKGGLIKRLDSYHTYFPESFYNLCFLLCNTGDEARDLEKEIHQELQDYVYLTYFQSRLMKHEWFKLTISQLRGAFLRVAQRHAHDTKLVFAEASPSTRQIDELHERELRQREKQRF